ncbi:RNA polymerase sigma factor [Mesobacillus harenae]|uniref:RNA polymerase sigma factor n=1 Tax=Mesobacillus harenae TaxID=2213203 RepID=UPI001F558B51|nr:RNA polymerase sigma factor [Mesobacillus harenae]
MVQEVFVKAIRKLDTFDARSSPKTWLFSIARHAAIDEMRKRKKETEKMDKALAFSDQPNPNTPEEIFQLNERKQEIYRGTKSLKQSYHDVLILKGIKELTVQEAAEVLGWNENKVKVTYHRAVKALEKKLGGILDGSS